MCYLKEFTKFIMDFPWSRSYIRPIWIKFYSLDNIQQAPT